MQQVAYPVQFSVEYPDRPLNRLTTVFRLFVAIPILIRTGERGWWYVGVEHANHTVTATAAGAGGPRTSLSY